MVRTAYHSSTSTIGLTNPAPLSFMRHDPSFEQVAIQGKYRKRLLFIRHMDVAQLLEAAD